jgi:hypothetical protein
VSRFPLFVEFLLLLLLTAALAKLLLETLLLLQKLFDGPPEILLLGEDVGVALITSDDCAGDSVLF